MKKLIEQLVRQRNPLFAFDSAISTRQVLCFFATQGIQWLRAQQLLLRGRKTGWMLMGKGVRIAYLSNIRWGKFLRLGDYVYISALGKKELQIGDSVGIGAYSRLVVSGSFHQLGAFIHIGNRVGIGEYAYLGGGGGLTIGDDCIIGQYLSCHPENHVYDRLDQLIRLQGVNRKGIQIGKNCWIGTKVTILDGAEIGDGCVIAAGAVVNSSFPPNSIIGGVPAKLLRTREASYSSI